MARRPGYHREQKLLKRYGLTQADYDKLLSEQGGGCALCGNANTKLYVDHCHKDGHVRGLLCNSCNVGLGHFKDNVNALRLAVGYLNRR